MMMSDAPPSRRAPPSEFDDRPAHGDAGYPRDANYVPNNNSPVRGGGVVSVLLFEYSNVP
jgi:hypothetical protein